MKQKESLTTLARQHIEIPGRTSSEHTVYGGHEHVLRQTLVSMIAGQVLAEHENPGEATPCVVHARVLLAAGEDNWSGSTGDLLTVPGARHSLTALEDSSVLLTVARKP